MAMPASSDRLQRIIIHQQPHTHYSPIAQSINQAMDTQNILAIPHHPPLPRAVSGVFQSVEHPYVVDQPPKRSPMAREFTAVHQQQRQQLGLTDRSYSRTPSSITSSNSSSQSTIHNAAVSSHANRPSTDFSDKDHHSLPLRSSIFSSSSDRCMPSRISRRDSIASTGSSIGSSDDILAGETQTNSMKRARRESIGSNDSVLPIENMRVSERKYTCDWHGCGQAFDRIEHLNRHKRRHTGEKPYRCLSSKCTKLFSRFDNMMQHVGIHSVEGHKTEIPNIKNLSKQGNGRGRARRTSYRGSQDPHEKFRRHVEGALGFGLARCCILPTENPDFSNMTLRPLLNTDVPSGSIPATIDEDAPLSSSFEMPPLAKRPRYDSVVDGMDKHPSLVGGGASSVSSDSSASMSPPNHIVMTHQQKIPGSFAESTIMRNGHINYRPIQLPANYPGMSSHQYYAMQQRQQQSSPHRRPTYPYVPAQQASASPMHRNSLGAIPSALRTSNIRSQPALRRD